MKQAGKLAKVYKEGGLSGSVIRGVKKALKNAGDSLTKMSDRLPMPVYSAYSLSSDDRVLLQRNGIFKDKHKGQRCFIIGDGPSLKNVDLSPLGNEITFVTNTFWKHPIVEIWQPKYYCLVDPVYFEGVDSVKQYFHSLYSRVWKAQYFVPLYYHVPLDTINLMNDQQLLPAGQTFFVALAGALYDSRPSDVDLTNFAPAVLNVAQLCLMVAIYMGCSPIYLLGLDHDWLASPGEDHHFYEEDTLPPTIYSKSSYKVKVEIVLKMWTGYEMLLDLANRKNITICNATKGSHLDIFKRVRYEEVVKVNETFNSLRLGLVGSGQGIQVENSK